MMIISKSKVHFLCRRRANRIVIY